tara:strand:- start:232 stop:384 length:153 start_codon:yes stop_codon:yes gene_type:complete
MRNNYLYLPVPEPNRLEQPYPQQPTATESTVVIIDLYEEEPKERDREVQE